MTDNKDIWEIVQGELKKSQPSHAYSTWFEPIKSMGIHEGSLLLELPNQFFYDWIQSHYIETIEKYPGGPVLLPKSLIDLFLETE